jgi:hypothetical protein
LDACLPCVSLHPPSPRVVSGGGVLLHRRLCRLRPVPHVLQTVPALASVQGVFQPPVSPYNLLLELVLLPARPQRGPPALFRVRG